VNTYDEVKSIWALVYITTFSRHSPGRTEKYKRRTVGAPRRNRTGYIPIMAVCSVY